MVESYDSPSIEINQLNPATLNGQLGDLNNNLVNINNFMMQQSGYMEENIILCWENYTVPLQELVKSSTIYENNMIEYYRLLLVVSHFCHHYLNKIIISKISTQLVL